MTTTLNVYFRPYKGKNGKYRAYFKYRGKQPSKVVETQKEGRQWAQTKKKEIDRELARLNALMFSAASYDYLLDCEDRNMTTGTVQEKLNHLTEFAEWTLAYIQRINPEAVDFLLDDVSLEIARKYYRHTCKARTVKTANNHVKNLKACWNFHIKEERILSNPWPKLEKSEGDEATVYIPPAEDVVAAYNAAKPWQQDYIQILLKTGGRAGDPRKLKWESVDFANGTLSFWTKKRKGGKKEYRIISMPEGSTLHTLLLKIWKDREIDSEYVFNNPRTGTGYTRQADGIKYMLHYACAIAGVRRFTLKDLRDFVALRLDDSKEASLTDIQNILGHKRPTTTDIYLKAKRGNTETAARILDNDDLV
ncbi:tyrosine-type recombinase/integrase [Maridesulfovibrio sp.]|uniref:tyrosine-type recombinase/integrase n=1 Tax=Maridesulfovibrio sp. TaxID=2795000 RepID=UPI003BAA410B